MEKYYVYILINEKEKIYVGMTNDLRRRLTEHAEERNSGYTQRNHIHRLVYFETFTSPQSAIQREKQLKGWKREKKNALVEAVNPRWEDLSAWIV